MTINKRIICILLGPILFICSICLIPQTIFPTLAARAAVGTVLWMAFWWITAPVDYAVTAFLPIALNAILPMTKMSDVIVNYASETILLLLGASILTVSWEETKLDKRIAAKFLSLIGGNLRVQLVFWFLLSALLSSVLPNAVACATITPIAVSMLKFIGEDDIGKSKKGSLILLTIVYAAGVGGLATPLGGAMNLVTVSYLQQITGSEFLYSAWVIRFFPIVVILVVSNILYLLKGCNKSDSLGGSREYFLKVYQQLGKMERSQMWSLGLFCIATSLAFTRQFYQAWLPGLKPAYSFIICAILSFFISHDKQPVMRWRSVQKKVIWELIYVFAGGLALGTLIEGSGAAVEIGNIVSNMGLKGGLGTIFIIIAITIALSDITSNTATAAITIPIVISIVNGIGLNPVPYVYIASIGINLSYMFPTSIRAVPVGYGLKPQFMFKKGVLLTVMVLFLMTTAGYALLKFWPAFSTI